MESKEEALADVDSHTFAGVYLYCMLQIISTLNKEANLNLIDREKALMSLVDFLERVMSS